MATILTIAQKFCSRTGLPVPSTLFQPSADDTATQIAALADEGCEDLAERHSWTTVQYSATWTSIAQEDQGPLTTLAPNKFLKIQNQTIFDRTTRLMIYGPLDPQEFQQLKALPNLGPLYRYRIMQGRLLILPAPDAGHTMAFDYASCGLIQGTMGGSIKEYFTDDTDEFLLPEKLLIRYLRWAWKREKGFPYAEDFASYERTVATASGTDGTKKVLSLDASEGQITPGIWVPAGSWPIP